MSIDLAKEIKACRVCRDAPRYGAALPHEPRPVCVLSDTARILICGQAPGTRVHATGIPFNDPSGDRLRKWMNIDRDIFYNSQKIAILPMGFCFPGQDARGADLPPRRECRELWHDRIMRTLPSVRLLLAVGQYAHAYHLGGRRGRSLTETVADWRRIRGSSGGTTVYPLPHPSWRNNAWIKRNPWFEAELLPEMRDDIANCLKNEI